ncbi:MAG TPA: M28 family peptidase, partial [Planctomycetota bacterium]|nr:M28 family peptidase [Planctomycetota bacterium]
MFRDLLAAVRKEASGERARETVRAVSGFHRVQASPGYDAAAAWLEGELRGLGLEPERDEAPGDGRTRCLGLLMPQGWECRHARAVLEDGGAAETLCEAGREPLSVVLRSAPVRGRFPVVDVGPGTEPSHYAGREVRGAVVLASGAVHRVHRLAAIERGAAGVLTDTRRLAPPVRLAGDERDALNYTSFWWNEREPRGWGFVVTPETGDRLRARLAAGARLFLDAVIDSRAFDTVMPLVSTRVGPAAGHEVLVTAHLCHPQTSANDNGSGVAAALQTARVLSRLAARGAWAPRHAVRFLW